MNLRQRLGRWLRRTQPLDLRLFDQLRRELRYLRHRALNAIVPARRHRRRELFAFREVSVNVGCGPTGRDGWINLDGSPHYPGVHCSHDARHPLPLVDGGARRIFAEHVLEHLDYEHDIPRVLADFLRVLAPGGVLRIVVPDAERYLRAYVEDSDQAWRSLGLERTRLPDGMLTPMEMINHVFHQGGEHRFGWDFATLEAVLRRAGFDPVVRQSFGVCLDPELAIDQPSHAPYSLYVDAVRPRPRP